MRKIEEIVIVLALATMIVFIVGGAIFLGQHIRDQRAEVNSEEELVLENGDQTEDSAEEDSSQETESEVSEESQDIEPENIAPEKALEGNVGTIFIGDSRFVQMNDTVNIGAIENQWCVASIGMGLDWFQNGALPQIGNIRLLRPDITTWRYVINLGVNDYIEAEHYVAEYEALTASDPYIQLTIVSVNPANGSEQVDNSEIEAFNKVLRDACITNGWGYIDTYHALTENGYMTYDGLHYVADTYQATYAYIELVLDMFARQG